MYSAPANIASALIGKTVFFHEIRSSLGLTSNQYAILFEAWRSGGLSGLSDLSELLHLSKPTIRKNIDALVEKGLLSINVYSDHEAFAKMNSGRSTGCLFCGAHKLLERHHYPVRRVDGGKKTIRICRSCHIEFHQITSVGAIACNYEFPEIDLNYVL